MDNTYGDDVVELDAKPDNDLIWDAEDDSKLLYEGDDDVVEFGTKPNNDSILDAETDVAKFGTKPDKDSILDAETDKKLVYEDLLSDDDVVILDDKADNHVIFKETGKKEIDSETIQLEKCSETYKNFRIELGGLPKFYSPQKLKQLLNQTLWLKSQCIKHAGMRKNVAYISFKDQEAKSKAMVILNGYKWEDVTLTTQEVDPTKDPMQLAKLDYLKVSKEYEQLPLSARIQKAVTPYHLMPYEYQIREKDQVLKSIFRQLGIELSQLNPDLENFIIWQKIHRKSQICEVDKFIEAPVKKEYCNNCEFAIGKNKNSEKPVVGFRVVDCKEGSVEIGPVAHLTNLNNKMKEVVKLLEKYLETSSYEPFDPFFNNGVWRQVTVRTSNNNDVMIIITINPQEMNEEEIYNIKEDLKSFFTNGNGANGGVTSIFIQQQREMESVKEPEYEHIYGKNYIKETILGKTFQVSPDASLQVNTPACAAMYKKIADVAEIDSTSIVLDIDCGVGALGLSLTKSCNYCLGVEMAETAVEFAGVNAATNGIGNALFNNGKAENYIENLKGCPKNKVIAIVHPPKAGLSVSVMNALRKCCHIHKLVYVSCDPQASLSNFQFLGRSRSKTCKGIFFVPIRATPVDLFPDTPHFGLIVVFEKYDECKWLRIMIGNPKPEDRKYFDRIPPVSKEFEYLQTERMKSVFSSYTKERKTRKSRSQEKRHLRRSPSPRRKRDERYNDNERAERRSTSKIIRDRLEYRRDPPNYRRRSPSRSRRDERYSSYEREEKRLKKKEKRDLLNERNIPPPPHVSKVEWKRGGDQNRQEWKISERGGDNGSGRLGEGSDCVGRFGVDSVGASDNRFRGNSVGDGGGNGGGSFGGGSVGEGGIRFGGGGDSVGDGGFGGGGVDTSRFGGGGVGDGRFGEGGVGDGRFGGGGAGDSRFGGGGVSDGGGRFGVGCDSSGFGSGDYWRSGGELGNDQNSAENDDRNRRGPEEGEKLSEDSQEDYGEGFQEGFQACLQVLKGQFSGLVGLDDGSNMTQTQKGFGGEKEKMDFSINQKESQVCSWNSIDDIMNVMRGGGSLRDEPGSLSSHSNFQDLLTRQMSLPASATHPSASLDPGHSGVWNQTGNWGSGGSLGGELGSLSSHNNSQDLLIRQMTTSATHLSANPGSGYSGVSLGGEPGSLSSHNNSQDLLTRLLTASGIHPSANPGPGYSGVWNKTENWDSGGSGRNFGWN